MQMMDEINYRVVRGLLSANAKTQVQQIEINLDDLKPVDIPPNTTDAHPLLRQKQS